jgi:hypothetical protein
LCYAIKVAMLSAKDRELMGIGIQSGQRASGTRV